MFKSGGKKQTNKKNPSLLLFELWAQDGAVVTPIKCQVWNLMLETETTKLSEHFSHQILSALRRTLTLILVFNNLVFIYPPI